MATTLRRTTALLAFVALIVGLAFSLPVLAQGASEAPEEAARPVAEQRQERDGSCLTDPELREEREAAREAQRAERDGHRAGQDGERLGGGEGREAAQEGRDATRDAREAERAARQTERGTCLASGSCPHAADRADN